MEEKEGVRKERIVTIEHQDVIGSRAEGLDGADAPDDGNDTVLRAANLSVGCEAQRKEGRSLGQETLGAKGGSKGDGRRDKQVKKKAAVLVKAASTMVAPSKSGWKGVAMAQEEKPRPSWPFALSPWTTTLSDSKTQASTAAARTRATRRTETAFIFFLCLCRCFAGVCFVCAQQKKKKKEKRKKAIGRQ